MKTSGLTTSLRETLEVFEWRGQTGEPLTTSEVTEELDVSRRSTYERLERLADQGYVETKKAGARGRVWWRPPIAGREVGQGAGNNGQETDGSVDGRSKRVDRREFRALVEAVEEYAIFMLDTDGHVKSWNRGARRIKGYQASEILGQHLSTFYTEDEVAAGIPERNLMAAAEHGTVEDEGWRLRADGSRFWANVTITALRDEEGTLQGFAKVTRDMTERHEYEQRLREEKAFAESILDNQRDIVAAFERDGQNARWNDRMNEVTGYDDERIAGMHPAEFAPESERERVVEVVRGVLENGESRIVEHRLSTADGETIPYEFSLVPMVDDDGEVIGMASIGRDVSERKARERRLERQRDDLESELNEVFDRISDGFFALDEDFRFTYVNDHAESLLDLSGGSAIGRDIWTVLELADPFEDALVQAQESQEPTTIENFYEPLDAWFESAIYPSETGVSVYFRDVTERKERERELVRYETLLEESRDVNAIIGTDGTFEYLTQSVTNVLGYDRVDLEGEDAFEYVHPDDRERAQSEFAALIERPDYEPSIEFRFERADGSWAVIEARARNLLDDPHIEGIVAYTRDVTERTERERELELYRTIVSAMEDGVYVVDEDDHFVKVNDAYVEMTGYDRDTLLGSEPSLVVDDDVQSEAKTKFEDIRAGERSNVTIEADVLRADGSTVRAESNITALPGSPTHEYRRVGVVRDVTDRVERERELEEARRRYETLFEHFPNGAVTLVDEELRYVTVGGRPLEAADVTVDELEGARVESVLPPDLGDVVVPGYRAALDGNARSFQHRVDDQHMQFRFVPVRDDDGDVFAALGMSQDVTERTEYERALEHRVRQQQAVTELGQAALETRDLDDLLSEAADTVASVLGNDYCKILDLDDEGEELLLRQGVGWHDGIGGSATVSATEDDSQAAYTLRVDEPVVVEDLTSEVRFSGPDLLASHDVHSGISVVIGAHDDPWGILGTHDTDVRSFSEHDVNFVRTVANILATAIERHGYEKQLVRQREQLAAFNSLNEVVRDTTEAVIEQSTREEIEAAVCEGLADADSFSIAWIGDVDAATQTVNCRTEAGVEDYLSDITISVDPEDERSRGPTGRAFLTGEVQVTQEFATDERHDPWRAHLSEYDVRSSAAIPIVHEGTTYGVLNVYADRPRAFEPPERRVLSQLGEVVGHAIAAVERKRALMSDEVVELEFHIGDVFEMVDIPSVEGRITLDQVVPSGDEFLVYGSATADARPVVDALVDSISHWDAITDLGEWNGTHRFELTLSEPPVLSAVAARGGYVDEAVIDDGSYRMSIHLPPTVETRTVVETVTDAYPSADLVAQRQFSRTGKSAARMEQLVHEELTDRQRAALEAAYNAGFFEWPRVSDGQDVADSLDVSPPTFHQHLRKAEQKVFERLLSSAGANV